MRLIVWKVGNVNLLLAPLTALFTFLVTHICCLGTILLPLGTGGITHYLDVKITPLKPLFYFFMFCILAFVGWKTYSRPISKMIEKVSFWFSVVLWIIMIFMS